HRRIARQAVGLLVVDHLQAVLDAAVEPIGTAEHVPDIGLDPSGRGQRLERVERRRRAQRGLAPAIDELMDLREELDLANAAAPALEVVAGAEALALRVMPADAARNPTNLGDRPVIEPAPPDEGTDRLQKTLPQRRLPGRGARADEGCP